MFVMWTPRRGEVLKAYYRLRQEHCAARKYDIQLACLDFFSISAMESQEQLTSTWRTGRQEKGT